MWRSIKQWYWLSFCILLSIVLSCTTKNTIYRQTHKNHERLFDFLEHLLFFESGVFTIAGSKPVSELCLFEPSIRSDAGDENAYTCKGFTYGSEPYEYWPIWEEKLLEMDMPNYIWAKNLFYDPPPNDSLKGFYHLINKENTKNIIKEHTAIFTQFVGFEFDVDAIVEEAAHPETSLFWNTFKQKMLEQSTSNVSRRIILGLMFGFGYENSRMFAHEFDNAITSEEIRLTEEARSRRQPRDEIIEGFRLDTFPIPGFVHYAENDPVRAKYRQERDAIKALYKDKDLVEFTLSLLCSAEHRQSVQ